MTVKRLENDILTKCLDVCSLAKEPDSELQGWMKTSEKFECDEMIFVEENNPELVYPKRKRIYFGFHGTKMTKITDIIDDLTLWPTVNSSASETGIGGSRSFRSRRSWDNIFKTLEKIRSEDTECDLSNYEIFICGHSLGGATAAVTYIRMMTKRRKIRMEKKKKNNEAEDFNVIVLGENPEDPETIAFETYKDDEKVEICVTETQKDILNEMSDVGFYCVTFGTPTFGNELNKKYCDEKYFSMGIHNIVHELDPIPRCFISIPVVLQNFMENFLVKPTAIIGNYQIFRESLEQCQFFAAGRAESNKKVKEILSDDNIVTEIKNHYLQSYLNVINNSATLDSIENRIKRVNDDFKFCNKAHIFVDDQIGKGAEGYVLSGLMKIKQKKTQNGGQNEEEEEEEEIKVAVKKIIREEPDIKETVEIILEDVDKNEVVKQNEIDNLLKLQHHSNIVQLFHCFQTRGIWYLTFEYCHLGNLNTATQKSKMNENDARIMLKQTLTALDYMHKKKVIHRDIKPDNILVSEKESNPLYKIGDVGLATAYIGRTMSTSQLFSKAVGTRMFMSPELYSALTSATKKVHLNPKTDVFSIGGTALYCLKGGCPWSEGDLHDFKSSSAIEDFIKKNFETILSKSLYDVMQKMLQHDKHKRWSAEKLLGHEFFNRQ